jgi:hypothetical protein
MNSHNKKDVFWLLRAGDAPGLIESRHGGNYSLFALQIYEIEKPSMIGGMADHKGIGRR